MWGGRLRAVLKDHPDVVRVLTGAFDLHLLPNRVEMRLKPSNRVIGYTVTFVPDDAGRVVGRGDVLQGPDARRAVGRARAAPGSACGGRRDGGGHRPRGQEPARRNRSHGRSASSKDSGRTRRAGGADGHHQRSQDGQLDRAGSPRLRATDSAAGGTYHRGRRGSGGHPARRYQGAPGRRATCPSRFPKAFHRFRRISISSHRSSPTC